MTKYATLILAFVALCLLSPVFASADPVITNGSFEAVQITTPFSTNPADIPGWTHTGDVGDALLWNATFPQCCGGTGTAKAGAGDQFVTMGGGFGVSGSSAWSQTIAGLAIGQAYVISFMMASEGETPTQQLTLGMTSGSSTAPETFTSIPTSTLFWQNWGSDQYTFLATATSATLQFPVIDQAYDVGLDAVSIAPASVATPEPATLTLLGSALLGLAGTLTRKRSAQASGRV
jgi:PEP-CTERM motif